MKFSTWNWPTHPEPRLRSCGVVIGPFFGILTYASWSKSGIGIKFRRRRRTDVRRG